MSGNRLILNDQTVLEDGAAGITGGSLCLIFPGYTMKQAADLMIEQPEKTGKIIFQVGDDEYVYTGHTECTSISFDADDGEITAILERR